MALKDVDQLTFRQLMLEGWRQFKFIDINFHSRLTVITGANGAGKSTILNILSKHYSWERPYLGTPTRVDGIITFFSGFYEAIKRILHPSSLNRPDVNKIGMIVYSDNSDSEIWVPKSRAREYNIEIPSQRQVIGLHVFSHREMPVYRPISSIPTDVISAEQAYGNFSNELITRVQGGSTPYSPTYRLKEALISMAIFGAGNQYVAPNKFALDTFLGFQNILTNVLPEGIGFVEIEIRNPDVVIKTKSGDFLIEASSGGLINLIDLAWQIHTYSIGKDAFVVTIDEPENHLHPAMQRTLLPKLLKTFPKAQFIVATHSPFMVSAVKDSHVYVLGFEQTKTERSGVDLPPLRSVTSTKLDTVNKAGNAAEILREVLGVPTTFPEWVEDRLTQIVEDYRERPFTNETLSALRAELTVAGLGELYPQALSSLVPRDSPN